MNILFSYTEVKKKHLSETSRDYLIISNPKEKAYDTLVVNGTQFDRTTPIQIKDEQGNTYQSISHYIACRKIKFLGLSQEMFDECLKQYTIPTPVIESFDYCEFETNLYAKYKLDIDLLSGIARFSWREHYVQIAVEGIMLALQQYNQLRKALIGTGNKVLCEVSASIAWGTDTENKFLKVAFPKKWTGENGYGQALMIARAILQENNGRI